MHITIIFKSAKPGQPPIYSKWHPHMDADQAAQSAFVMYGDSDAFAAYVHTKNGRLVWGMSEATEV